MNALFHARLLAAYFVLSLVACDGGGYPAGIAEPDIQTSVPAPTYAPDLLGEFNRINAVRQGLGLGLLAQATPLDTVAADHLDYLYKNPSEAAYIGQGGNGLIFPELAANPGYTGATELARCARAGYGGQCAAGAVRDDSPGSNPAIVSPYFALSVLSQGEREIGIGKGPIAAICLTGCATALEIQLGRPTGQPPQRQAPGFLIATYLWGAFHIHVNEGENLVVDTFEVRDRAGQILESRLLTGAGDPAGRVPTHAAMLVPSHAPTCGSAYTVSFSGKRGGHPFSTSWTDDACSDLAPSKEPPYDADRDILSTSLAVDLAAREAVADIRVAPSEQIGLSLNIGDLDILSVTDGALPLRYRVRDADGVEATPERRIDIATGAGERAVLRYRFMPHAQFDGWSPAGFTFLWPDHCENLFPCERSPADGTAFTLSLEGVAPGLQAIHPSHLDSAPAYQIGWVVGDYRWLDLGVTTGGTRLRAAYLPGHDEAARAGTLHLRDIFSWYESNLGTYPWGGEAATVEIDWGDEFFGGMEQHPYWQVSRGNFDDLLAHAHEAAHGWYGNGVRLACWEDFVLSEGTVSYLAATAIGAVLGAEQEAAVWLRYERDLSRQTSRKDHTAWPAGCSDSFEVTTIFDVIPYYRGANFYRSVEEIVGRPALLGVLRRFFESHRHQAATMADMLDAIEEQTGYDPHPLAMQYLRRYAGGDFS